MKYSSTKVLELGSCAFRQWRADSHCKFVHGYRLIAKFWFGCSQLDERNWVVDFGGLDELKKILAKQFDHTLCVAEDDPLLEGFKSLHAAGGCNLRIMKSVGIEKTAEWCLSVSDEYIRQLTKNRCWVEKVEVWEHEKNSSIVTLRHNNETLPVTAFTGLPVITQTQTNGNSETVATSIQPPLNQVKTFLEDVHSETGINVGAILKNAPLGNQPNQPAVKPANVGKNVSSGYGNLFGGTSWGV